jgi:hypothetical protein
MHMFHVSQKRRDMGQAQKRSKLPRLRSGFRRAALTPHKRLNFDYTFRFAKRIGMLRSG